MNQRFAITVGIILLLGGLFFWLGPLGKERPTTKVDSVSSTPTPASSGNVGDPAQTLAPNSEKELPAKSAAFRAAADSEKPIVHPEIQDLIQKASAAIPTKSDLKKLSLEEIHFTPVAIQKAALGIGNVSQAVKDHPEYAREALQFYRTCSENAESSESIAATCYHKFQETQGWYPELKSEKLPTPSERVLKIANKITF